MTFQDSSFLIVSKTSIDRFQSRGQQLCKLLGIIESFNMRIKFKSHWIFFVHKHASRRDVRWKRSIENFRFKDEETTKTRFHLNFFRVFSENKQPGKLHYRTFSLEKQKRLLFWGSWRGVPNPSSQSKFGPNPSSPANFCQNPSYQI